jgi:GTP-binding protein
MHWKTSTNRAPREHTPGEPGEELTLRLELKLMADAGLVGFPNAGKSSLLTRLTSAHPKIASYPFTTLNPIVGTMIFEDYSRLTVADIPGLIDGSHSGIGLGDAFLRHIERCSLLIYVIDMAGSEDRHPARDYLALTKELQLYAEDLPDRPSLIVANKMDLPGADRLLSEFFEETGKKPIPVSALTGEGIDRLKTSLFKLWQQKNRPRRRKASVRDPV